MLVILVAPTRRPVLFILSSKPSTPPARAVRHPTSGAYSLIKPYIKSLDHRQCYAYSASQAAKLDAVNVPPEVDVEPHINPSQLRSGPTIQCLPYRLLPPRTLRRATRKSPVDLDLVQLPAREAED